MTSRIPQQFEKGESSAVEMEIRARNASFDTITFNVLPSSTLPPLQKSFHCLKKSFRLFAENPFITSTTFAFTASSVSNPVPFSSFLTMRNKKKSHGVRSGEESWCSTKGIPYFARNVLTDIEWSIILLKKP
ncbi:hypothetical protein AVEN_143312-1 [Araneus ventricosus]|uniref:Uncharacterized protein n=1 Tax=Araneus ventricosus TaxID=182803 RepID=A0A4Y2AGB8_ARAVE|nr:hypothetical protein AVEN_143312-1 [Araneus ventricosus]